MNDGGRNRTDDAAESDVIGGRLEVEGPLEGVRVIEVSTYSFVPSCGAVLADWGADVMKFEPPESGDPIRGLALAGIPPGTNGFTVMWEMANRGKRSVAIDIAKPEGRTALLRAAEKADVFITNLLPHSRRRLGVDVDDIRAVNPSIIYARGHGQGTLGPGADDGGFDYITFWARSGIAAISQSKDAVPSTMPTYAFGDVTSGAFLAGGIAAALVRRGRTGQGSVVDTSLLGSAMWASQVSVIGAEVFQRNDVTYQPRLEGSNPLMNAFRTADDRFVSLCMIQSDRYWSDLCGVLGCSELALDERFDAARKRAENSGQCVLELDKVFASRPLSDWVTALSKQKGQWSVVQSGQEVHNDVDVRANGYIQRVDYGAGRTIDLVAAPAQFDEQTRELLPAPELGAHTEEALLEMGYTWEEITELSATNLI